MRPSATGPLPSSAGKLPDAAAHEVSYGFTEQNLDWSTPVSLAYQRGLPDMAGSGRILHEGQQRPAGGAQIRRVGSLRYFEDPPNGKSIGHAKAFHDGIDDAPQLRVCNRAFYLLANTSGCKPGKAFEVFVLANRLYWGPNTTFDPGACRDQAATIRLQRERRGSRLHRRRGQCHLWRHHAPTGQRVQKRVPVSNLTAARAS